MSHLVLTGLMVRSQRCAIKMDVVDAKHVGRRLDISEKVYDFLAKGFGYPEELGDTLKIVLGGKNEGLI